MTNLLAAILGISFSAGLNTYATVLALGLLDRFGVVELPPSVRVVATTPVLIAAALLYLVEFVADKIPWFDSVWDGIHLAIRPAAGALLAYGVVENFDPQWQVIAALAGGSIALTSHTTKASTRAAVNLSPEPFSNWFLSLAEDGIAFFLVWLVTTHPFIGAIVALAFLALSAFVLWKFSTFVRRAFRRTG
jgi:hypothetical protein